MLCVWMIYIWVCDQLSISPNKSFHYPKTLLPQFFLSDLNSLHSKNLRSFIFSTNILGKIIKNDSIIGNNDKIDIKNKLKIYKCRIFICG
jgi:hypothetical protein